MENKYIVLIFVVLVGVAGYYVVSVGGLIPNNELPSVNESYVDENYDIDVSEDGEAQFSVTYRRVEDERYSTFKERYLVPYENFKVHSVSDSDNKVEYRVDEDEILYQGDFSGRMRSAMFHLNYTVKLEDSDKSTEELKEYIIRTSGVEGRRQSIRIEFEEKVLSLYKSTKHYYSIKNNSTVIIEGDGPMTTKVLVGQPDETVRNVAIFNESDELNEIPIEDIEDGYQSALENTGVERTDATYPVVILDSEEFEQKFKKNDRIRGTYRNGVVYLPHMLFSRSTPKSVVAHEIVHAINGQISIYLPDWFDEGTAVYTQLTASDKHGEPYSEPFTTQYSEQCSRPQITCRVAYSERNASSLIEYINENKTYITDNQWSIRTPFGYSYANLFINSVVKQSNNTSLLPIYKDLINNNISQLRDSKNKENMTDILLKRMGEENLDPCSRFYDNQISEDESDACLETNNEVIGYPEGVSEVVLDYRIDLEYRRVVAP
jgi:hypothetical protein